MLQASESAAEVPLVSVGVPVYNGEAFLEDAIRSVLTQTLDELELILCDNASTDRTAEICRDYAARDPRVRYFRNARNLGAAANYNLAFSHARGRYFKWLAHDDRMLPSYLAKTRRILEERPDAVLCNTVVSYIDSAGAQLGLYDSRLSGADSLSPSERFAWMVLRSHTCVDFFGLLRREALRGSLLHDTFHGADRALLAQLALRGRMIQLPAPLLAIREHPNRYTRAQRALRRPRGMARRHRRRPTELPDLAAVSGVSEDGAARGAIAGGAVALLWCACPVVELQLERCPRGGGSACGGGTQRPRAGGAPEDTSLWRRSRSSVGRPAALMEPGPGPPMLSARGTTAPRNERCESNRTAVATMQRFADAANSLRAGSAGRFRIAMVAACPMPARRGTPLRVERLAEALAARGHHVELVTYHVADGPQLLDFPVHRIFRHPVYWRMPVGPSFRKLALVRSRPVLEAVARARRTPIRRHSRASRRGTVGSPPGAAAPPHSAHL